MPKFCTFRNLKEKAGCHNYSGYDIYRKYGTCTILILIQVKCYYLKAYFCWKGRKDSLFLWTPSWTLNARLVNFWVLIIIGLELNLYNKIFKTVTNLVWWNKHFTLNFSSTANVLSRQNTHYEISSVFRSSTSSSLLICTYNM